MSMRSVKDKAQGEGNSANDLSSSLSVPGDALGSKMQAAPLLEGNSHEAAVLETNTSPAIGVVAQQEQKCKFWYFFYSDI